MAGCMPWQLCGPSPPLHVRMRGVQDVALGGALPAAQQLAGDARLAGCAAVGLRAAAAAGGGDAAQVPAAKDAPAERKKERKTYARCQACVKGALASKSHRRALQLPCLSSHLS
jgi:hypothetical protein